MLFKDINVCMPIVLDKIGSGHGIMVLTVNSESFARVLSSRKAEITLSFTDICKS